MKIYLIISLILITAITAFSSYYLLDNENTDLNYIISSKPEWIIKEKEKNSRYVKVPIMLYHNIDGKGSFSLDLDQMKDHFQLIKDKKLSVVTVSDIINKMETGKPFDKKAIAITFDDGYISMYTKLLPIVKEFHYPVTLFVYINNVYIKADKSITWANLAEMDRNGIDIQSHSITHLDLEPLTKKNDPDAKRQLFNDIYLSKRIIELYLQKKVSYFAFPYGRYNLKLIELCRYAGYNRVFSTDYRSHIITRDNYCLGRGHIKNNYSIKFMEQITE